MFLEDPLEFLTDKPVHLMTDMERRQWLSKIRTMRANTGSLKAEIEEQALQDPIAQVVAKKLPKKSKTETNFDKAMADLGL